MKCGVRQGCVLVSDRFFLYSEIIMEGYLGIEVGGHNINNLRYPYGTSLIAERIVHFIFF